MAKLRTSIQDRYSLQKHAVVDRLHQIIDRALPQTPDAVGFLLSSGADDHRYVPGRLVAGDGARRLVSVRAGHDDIHQNEVRLLALRLGDRLVSAFGGHALAAGPGELLPQELAVRR